MKTLKLSRRVFSIYALNLGLFYSSKSWSENTNYEIRFKEIWNELNNKYCFFEKNQINWDMALEAYLPIVKNCKSESQFVDIIDSLLRETMDAHTHLKNANTGSPRWPPYDLYVENINGKCIIKAVHEYSSAKLLGLKENDEILEIDDISIFQIAHKLMPKSLKQLNDKALNYLLNQAAAGNRGQTRKIKFQNQEGIIKTIVLNLYKGEYPQNFETKFLENSIGYIAIHNFGDGAIINQFDSALSKFKDTKGLIIDVRYNGGGDTAIARPIMGRFIKAKKLYSQMAKIKNKKLIKKWPEFVLPRGPFTYEKPVAILCNHWSASMAEGFPMGMRAICGAKIIGTKMMGLGAAVYNSNKGGLDFQYSAEPVFDINGISRDDFLPDVILQNNDDFIKAAQTIF